jgi:pimeloyl-ACP methyl ester carboxylesterase
MDAVGIERASLVGNSMGGHVASETAILYPDRVETLVLIGASGLRLESDEPFELPFVVRLLRWPVIGPLARMLPTRETLRERILPAYYDPEYLTEERLDDWYAPLRTRGGMNGFLARLSHPIPEDRPDQVRKISAPTLVIAGDTDRLVDPAVSARYHELIPGSELRVLVSTGHMPQEERPELIVSLVSRWVEAHPSGRSRSR